MIRLYHPLSKFNDRKFLQALGVLDEANVGGVLTEAAAAQVEAVLANDTVGVAAHAAATAQHGTEVSTTRRMALHPLDNTASSVFHSHGHCSGARDHPAPLTPQLS